MKLQIIQQAEQQTFREMGVFHPHPRVRIRAQAIVRLSQGLTLQQTANECKDARIIGELDQQANTGECELLFYDDSSFRPNPPIRWAGRLLGKRMKWNRCHVERVNVLGALHHDHKLHLQTQRRPTVRDDVIAFFAELAAQNTPCRALSDAGGLPFGHELMHTVR